MSNPGERKQARGDEGLEENTLHLAFGEVMKLKQKGNEEALGGEVEEVEWRDVQSTIKWWEARREDPDPVSLQVGTLR